MTNTADRTSVGVQPRVASRPRLRAYDVIIIGGATSGWSIAWHLLADLGYRGTVLVVERDTSLRRSATAASNNCMRQQFATPINVEIAQYAAFLVRNFRDRLGGDPDVPSLQIRDFGYLYLSDSTDFTEVLRADQRTQVALGAGTQMLTVDETAQRYPFLNLDGVDAASLNLVDEGAFDARLMVDWLRDKSLESGAELIENTVVGMDVDDDRITAVRLETGEILSADIVVDAAGTRAGEVARMAGVDLPIEARRRYTCIVSAEHPLDRDLPLTIDPSGVHVRSYGPADYLVGCPPIGFDGPVDPDDFEWPEPIWDQKMRPVLRRLLPGLGELTVTDSWMGHYEFNTFDHNAVVGPHSTRPNLLLCAGFSGHGSQQGPACGRGIAELIVHGEYRSLDLSPLSHERIADNAPMTERAVI